MIDCPRAVPKVAPTQARHDVTTTRVFERIKAREACTTFFFLLLESLGRIRIRASRRSLAGSVSGNFLHLRQSDSQAMLSATSCRLQIADCVIMTTSELQYRTN